VFSTREETHTLVIPSSQSNTARRQSISEGVGQTLCKIKYKLSLNISNNFVDRSYFSTREETHTLGLPGTPSNTAKRQSNREGVGQRMCKIKYKLSHNTPIYMVEKRYVFKQRRNTYSGIYTHHTVHTDRATAMGLAKQCV